MTARPQRSASNGVECDAPGPDLGTTPDENGHSGRATGSAIEVKAWFRRHPYMTSASAVFVGFALGGGLSSPQLRRAAAAAARFAFVAGVVPMLQRKFNLSSVDPT